MALLKQLGLLSASVSLGAVPPHEALLNSAMNKSGRREKEGRRRRRRRKRRRRGQLER